MTIIVGIDPGETTGVCAIDEAQGLSGDFQVVGVHQIPWDQRIAFFTALFAGTVADNKGGQLLPEIVVIESFKLFQHQALAQTGSIFPSVRVIGIVEALLSLCNPKPLLVFQDPIQKSRVEILPQHASMFVGLIHAGDAYRHCRYYHVTTRR